MQRCLWVNLQNPLYVKYHDEEWGEIVTDDQKLFEMICLEGAQAGLSWETVLNKREGYRRAFYNFDIEKCSKLSDEYLESQRENAEIIRNKLKIYSVRRNAIAALEIIKEFGSLHDYFWGFIEGEQIILRPTKIEEYNANSEVSDAISEDLKKRGMNFVGSTIVYAFMQACGMVDEHGVGCFKGE